MKKNVVRCKIWSECNIFISTVVIFCFIWTQPILKIFSTLWYKVCAPDES